MRGNLKMLCPKYNSLIDDNAKPCPEYGTTVSQNENFNNYFAQDNLTSKEISKIEVKLH